MDFYYLSAMMLMGVVYVLGGFFFSRLLAPSAPNPTKTTPYECGEFPHGTAWARFNVGYYLFALLFLIFDVEIVFFFPWAVVLKEIGLLALVEGGIFLAVLTFGLVFAWRKGYLVWH